MSFGTITLFPQDLKSIMDRLEEKKWSGGPVQITDNGDHYALRDAYGMSISFVNKTVAHPQEPQSP